MSGPAGPDTSPTGFAAQRTSRSGISRSSRRASRTRRAYSVAAARRGVRVVALLRRQVEGLGRLGAELLHPVLGEGGEVDQRGPQLHRQGAHLRRVVHAETVDQQSGVVVQGGVGVEPATDDGRHQDGAASTRTHSLDERGEVGAIGRRVGLLVVVGELDEHQVAAPDERPDGREERGVLQVAHTALAGVAVVGDGRTALQVLRQLLAPARVRLPRLVAHRRVPDEQYLAGARRGGDADRGGAGAVPAKVRVRPGVPAGPVGSPSGVRTFTVKVRRARCPGRGDGVGEQGAAGLGDHGGAARRRPAEGHRDGRTFPARHRSGTRRVRCRCSVRGRFRARARFPVRAPHRPARWSDSRRPPSARPAWQCVSYELLQEGAWCLSPSAVMSSRLRPGDVVWTCAPAPTP